MLLDLFPCVTRPRNVETTTRCEIVPNAITLSAARGAPSGLFQRPSLDVVFRFCRLVFVAPTLSDPIAFSAASVGRAMCFWRSLLGQADGEREDRQMRVETTPLTGCN